MEASTSEINEWAQIANGNSEDTAIPHFYMRAVENKRESEAEGRPIFDEVPFVEILIPGDKYNCPDVKVSDEHKQRWPAQWANFLAKREQHEGTLIEHWPYMSVKRVAELKALNFFTVEQVAEASDAALDEIGLGARDLQQRARHFLQPQEDTETDLRKEIQALNDRIREAESRNETLQDEVAKLREAAPKRGRPRKVVADDAA